MEFDPSGAVLACCANALFPLGRVGETPLIEIWRGPRARALREAVARQDFSLGCTICSHRIRHHGAELPMAGYDLLAGTTDGEWPSRLSFSLHNTCNLECVMCGADRSSRIRTRRARLAPLPHVYDDSFFSELDEFLPHIDKADFVGGEPFLVREHWRVWDRLWEVRPDVRCSVTTNATVWNARVEQVLERFDTDLRVSLDALDPELFEAIRVGADFAEVMRNFERIHAYSLDRNTSLSISFCFLRHNWHQLMGMLEWAEERSLRVHVQTVIEREHGAQHLPDDELVEVLRAMHEQAATRRDALRLNGEVWDRQIVMLEEELRRRRAAEPYEPCMEPPHPDNPARVEATVDRWLESQPGVADGRVGLPPAAEEHLRSWGFDPAAGERVPLRDGADGVRSLIDSWPESDTEGVWVIEELPLDGALVHTIGIGGVHRDGAVVIYRVVAFIGPEGPELRVFRDAHTRPSVVEVELRSACGPAPVSAARTR